MDLSVIEKLRKERRLPEARRAAEEAYSVFQGEPAVVSLLADIYIDILEQALKSGVNSTVGRIEERLEQLLLETEDNEMLTARLKEVKLHAVKGYDELEKLTALSVSDENAVEAYEEAFRLLTEGHIDPSLHEMVAVILYRAARQQLKKCESVPFRRLLAQYFQLRVTKPSQLHSRFLALALKAKREYRDEFSMVRFLHLWDPRYFRKEDIEPAPGHAVSLAASVMVEILSSDEVAMFNSLIEEFTMPLDDRLKIMRDACAISIAEAVKLQDRSYAIDLLELYISQPRLHAASRSHSMVLKSAFTMLVDDYSWRLPSFLIEWDCSLLSADDWVIPFTSRSNTLKPFIISVLDRCNTIIEADLPRHSYIIPALLAAYDVITASRPGYRAMLEASKARLMMINGDRIEAIDLLKRQIINDGSCVDPWLALSDTVEEGELKKSVLSLALQHVVKDEDIVKLHVALSRQLHLDGDDSLAAGVLDEISVAADPEVNYLSHIIKNDDTTAPYSYSVLPALDFIYGDIKEKNYAVVECDERTVKLQDSLGDSREISFITFPHLKDVIAGDTIALRLNDGMVVTARQVEDLPYSALPLLPAVVVKADAARVVCASKQGSIPCENTSLELNEGDIVNVRIRRRDGVRVAIPVEKIELASVLNRFSNATVVVYDVKEKTAYYTAGEGEIKGTVIIEDNDKIKPGDIFTIYYYINDSNTVKILKKIATPGGTTPALKEVNGKVTVTASGKHAVKDVSIPENIIKESLAEPGTYVTVMAVYQPATEASTPSWRALNLTTY